MKKYIFSLLILFVILLGALAVKAAVSNSVSGWAWSSNIGWISFNSADNNTGTGGVGKSPNAYSVTVNENGTFSGYAWSSNVGWISFNSSDISDCTGATPAIVSTTTGNVSGWIRVISGKGRTDGWDGCIKLSDSGIFPTGVSDGTRGVTFATSSTDIGKFKGYAWGSDVLGWVQFSPNLQLPVVCSNNCGSGGGSNQPTLNFYATSEETGSSVNSGGTLVLYKNYSDLRVLLEWSSTNTSSCTASGNWNNPIGTSGSKKVDHDFVVANYSYTVSCDPTDPAYQENITSTINVNVAELQQPPQGACVQPLNAVPCSSEPAEGVTGTTRALTNPSSCPSTDNQNVCNYTCANGFSLRAGQCVNASLEES